jgi:hypothetical protein
VGRWQDLGFYIAMRVILPFVMIEVSFDFFGRSGLDDFNIILIAGTEGMVGEMEGVFGIGVKLVSGVEDILVEERTVDFFLMSI